MAFVANLPGIAAMGAMPQMVEFMGITAEKIEVRVRDISPVETGEFRASIQSESGIENALAFGRVFSVDDKAVYIEFGTIDTPTFQPFRRALEGFAA